MKASISRVKCFTSCRRAYYFKYIEGLDPVKKSDALETGLSYHEKIEKLYRTGTIDAFDNSKESAMATAYYLHIYPRFKMRAVEEWESKACGSHIMIGRVDGISEDGRIVEHKTTSSDIEEFIYNLQWDEQIKAYMYLTGKRDMYYTIIKKPTIRQRKGESDLDFYLRVVAWYDVDTDSKIRLINVTCSDEEIERFAKDFKWICNEMEFEEGMAKAGNTDGLYRNSQHCNKWGTRCEYSSICMNYDPSLEYVEFTKERRRKNEV